MKRKTRARAPTPPRTGGLVAKRLTRNLRIWLATSRLLRWRYGAGGLDRLVIAPHELRTADAVRAGELAAGRFTFAGKTVLTEGASPFAIPPPTPEWGDELMGFSWLRHLRAAGTPEAQASARALIDDWISSHGRFDDVSWAPEVLSRRIISWLSHAPMVLRDAPPDFYRRFMRSLLRQVRFLRATAHHAPEGYPRLVTSIALAFAGLCLATQRRLLRTAQRQLTEELSRQLLPDGVHVSRNPGVLVELLLDLLPLRQAFAARTVPPEALLNAIDRAMPMLRFFRHRDGTLANFNGMGATALDHLTTLLAYDDARGRPVASATFGGYQRIEAGSSVVLLDTGRAPPPVLSGEAHAGCLSFELSVGKNRLVVNCGMPVSNRDAWRTAARATAAHSTVVIADTSSCRFLTRGAAARLCGALIVDGPHDVRADRAERSDSILVRASHDGYVGRYGVVHQRSMRLTTDGARLDGEDFFQPVGAGRDKIDDDDFAVRFHFHPAVRINPVGDGESVLLVLPDRDAWLFVAYGVSLDLEESIYLGANDGPRRTTQIVLNGRLRNTARVRWTFVRAEANTIAGI